MRALLYAGYISAALILFSSCQKEFENPNITVIPPASSLDTFRVEINGTAFPTYGILTTNSFNTLNVIASDVLALKKVILSLPTNISTGVYPLDFFGMVYYGTYYPDTLNTFISSTGSVTIVENNAISKRIRGNFDFIAQSIGGGIMESQLNNGYFSVKYP